jgi:hypothetical protein
MFIATVGLDTHHLAIITGFKLLQVCLHPAQATCHTPLSLVTWKEAKNITHNKGTVMQCLGLTHFCWYYRLHGNVMVLTKTNHLHVPCWPETASSYKTDRWGKTSVMITSQTVCTPKCKKFAWFFVFRTLPNMWFWHSLKDSYSLNRDWNRSQNFIQIPSEMLRFMNSDDK